ncbi:MAG: hypothetical protein IJ438_11780 [Clostridia bacterium]|nr:hypothetical protein [Clostridia bacterium]
MRLNTTDISRKCQHPLLLSAGSLPIGALLLLGVMPQALHRLWLFPAAYIPLAWACLMLPGKCRLIGGAAGFAALMLLGCAVLPVNAGRAVLLLPALYGVLLMLGLPMGGWPREQELPAWLHMAGVVAHIAAQIFVNATRRTGTLLLEPVSTLLLVSFLLFLALVMLSLNRSSLDSAAQSRRTVPILMRRQNTMLTFTLLLLTVLVAAIPAIGSALQSLWDGLVRLLAMAAALIASLFPTLEEQPTTVAPMTGMGDMGLEQTQGPSQLALVLEKIFSVVALVILVILVLYFGRILLRKLRVLLRYLWQQLGRYGSAATEDYEDEITDTRDDEEFEQTSLMRKWRTRLSRPDEKRMTPTQRVRHRYGRLRLRHPEWLRASTARETLPSDAAQVYERARYSGQSLTDEEAERFRTSTRRL